MVYWIPLISISYYVLVDIYCLVFIIAKLHLFHKKTSLPPPFLTTINKKTLVKVTIQRLRRRRLMPRRGYLFWRPCKHISWCAPLGHSKSRECASKRNFHGLLPALNRLKFLCEALCRISSPDQAANPVVRFLRGLKHKIGSSTRSASSRHKLTKIAE